MSLSFLGLFDEDDDDDDDDDTCIIENGMIISECLNVSTCDSAEVHSVHDLSSSEATTSLHAMLSSTPQHFSSSVADGSSMDVSSIPSIDMSPISEPLSYIPYHQILNQLVQHAQSPTLVLLVRHR